MSFLLKLLVLIVAAAAAVKFGIIDQVALRAHDVALQGGMSEDQLQMVSEQAQSLLSFGGILAAIGTLPAPFDAVGKAAFILVLVALALSLLLAAVMTIVRALRWMRDIAV